MTAGPERLAVALSDRYRLVRELGAGGMATVYLAHDLKHDRQVAVKVLRPELAAVIGAERFVVEIKTTAQLQHPHILPLFDSGTATAKGHGSRVTGPDGSHDLDDPETRDPRPATFLYYVMPYIDGETLRAKLDRETQFSVDEAVRITVAVADALDYAHRHGVIHRDIKPENILLHDGRPMVADFGIALALSAAAGGRLTETGMSLGTPHYMSPEQATADKELSGRSDIYSLGSVLYEMLAGQPPHLGGSAQQIIMKIIAEPAPPVTAFRKSVPSNVAAAVAKSLEKLPADRFETAMAFGNALVDRQFTIPGTAAIGAFPPLGRRRAPLLVVGAVAVLAAALAAWGWFRPTAWPAASRLRVALATHPIAPGHVGRGLALSPDGATIVFADSVDGTPRLWIKMADQADPKPLAGTEGADAATFSPDGRWIAFIADGKVRKIPVGGGAPVTIADSAAGAGGSNIPPAVAWLDDDTVLYADRGFGLR
ncbi:MAG TPA: protein kinase, partial [Gemmatimonadales bacterium]|nr:protein kinase [Gemmatimonadales bacterium]